MKTRELKSRIGELFFEILLIDVTQEHTFNSFIEGAIALARLIEVNRPNMERKLVEQVEAIEQGGYIMMNKKIGDKEQFQNVIRMKAQNTFTIANIRRDVKNEICELLQEILTEERILEE